MKTFSQRGDDAAGQADVRTAESVRRMFRRLCGTPNQSGAGAAVAGTRPLRAVSDFSDRHYTSSHLLHSHTRHPQRWSRIRA